MRHGTTWYQVRGTMFVMTTTVERIQPVTAHYHCTSCTVAPGTTVSVPVLLLRTCGTTVVLARLTSILVSVLLELVEVSRVQVLLVVLVPEGFYN